MPKRLKSYCRYPLCPDPIEKEGERFCEFHRSMLRRQRRRDDRLTSHIESTARKGYGARWRKARSQYLHSHPLCVAHLARGQQIPATVVDHIIPHKKDHERFWDRSNWQALCDACHNAKTGEENRRRTSRIR